MAENKLENSLKIAIGQSVNKCFEAVDITPENIMIEIPKDSTHGDYSTNIAMQLTRTLHKNPREIATAIVDSLDQEAAHVEKVEIAGPGFINFFMKNDALTSVIAEVLSEKDNYGQTHFGEGKKYNVEFVSANPTGDLHLGHAKGAAVGDSICRIMTKAGYDVTREYYINDAGKQITNLALSLYSRYLALFDIERPIPEDGYMGQDVIDIAKSIKEKEGDALTQLTEEEAIAYFRKVGTEHELQKIKDILKEFRVSFDVWFSETSLYEGNKIEPAINKLKEKGYTIAYTILKDHSKELEEKDFYTISESLDIPYESVFDELAHMQECNPFPCSEYDTESTTNLALPEFTIEIVEDQLKIIPKEMGNLSLHCEEVKLSKEAKKYLISEASESLIDMEKVTSDALSLTENMGIIFLDEIDKIASGNKNDHGDVARHGVQRDLLPIVEGTTVNTKYGPVKTDHILFIAAGAFHTNKPSDLIPELQGRFPIRVELKALSKEDFKDILVNPKNAITKQYQELLKTEGVSIEFEEEALDSISDLAYNINTNVENIGARRLYTIMEKVFEDISFTADEHKGEFIKIKSENIKEAMKDIEENRDISRYIL